MSKKGAYKKKTKKATTEETLNEENGTQGSTQEKPAKVFSCQGGCSLKRTGGHFMCSSCKDRNSRLGSMAKDSPRKLSFSNNYKFDE
ncbi:MAG: hypothetical protein FJZ43_01000 [Candidatus Staskawiczbacteria bacterium]|nr:hypothetical protein [Candidatus Staskawiczbacteria bacterium]